MKDPINTKSLINIYPNPANNLIHFSTKSNVEIMNLTGRVVASYINVSTIDISQLPEGIYLANFLDDKGVIIQRSKVVKY